MKPTLFYFSTALTILFLVSNNAYAKIWRVNSQSNFNNTSNWGENYGGTPSYPVFKQINEAVASASVVAGDTLHIEGSVITYNDAIITKRLVIIGPGYFLTENTNVSNTTYDAKIGWIQFNPGSEYSQLIGMNIINDGNTADGKVYVTVNDITVKRCRMERGVQFGTLLTDVYILQNYFAAGTNTIYTNGNTAFVSPSNIYFNNNICLTTLLWANKNILECNNNVFAGPANVLNLDFNTGSFKNNILKSAGITANINGGANNNVQYNTVSNSGVFVGTTGNVWEPNMTALFVTNSTSDGNYKLQAAATNNVAGSDGAERGAFGGASVIKRYTLSGLAAIPVAYDVTTNGVSQPGTGLLVSVKARTIN
ncbi:hypothetical protein VP395_01335 [Mariniflexile soesokkakense]|uniref:Right handed beta helix domain-containing protein n=1 Tax=Mariniflexile soesokkakense TaxID=1343160 RepID=A0ABV0A5Y7_9FLAO